MLIKDFLGSLDVQVSIKQGQYLHLGESVVGQIDVALEKRGQVMQSGRVYFFVLHAHEQTYDGEILMGEGSFVGEEGVQALRVEGGCTEESAAMQFVVEVDATVFEECDFEVCPAVRSHHGDGARDEGLRDGCGGVLSW